MDPYCAYMMNNKRIKGQVCKSGGQHPVWNDTVTVPMEVDQPACVVELMDKDKLIDDSIGTFVIDLNEVQSLGQVSKWYPVFHKNKPAGQILFEAAFQPLQQVIPVQQVVQPVVVEKVIVEEVRPVVTQHVQETTYQSGYTSNLSHGTIPGGDSIDGPLYGRVVSAQPLHNLPNQPIHGGLTSQQHTQGVPLGGPLSGSLGGGLLGTTELRAGEVLSNVHTTQVHSTQMTGTQFTGNQMGGMNQGLNQGFNQGFNQGSQMGGMQQGLNQIPHGQGNLQQNFDAAHISNAQLGGGGLYKETAYHPTADAQTGKSKVGGHLPNQGTIVPGDVIGGHTQTNQF